ncbi:hypothetical protein QP810_10890 [Streptococcus agalactiae]|uniref:hypothetical protein n=1 Tax=Streptococcus agalactiae TaxID=1311 RepID=UPI0025578F28|nr:hypothetical protein [Streptococcus agalactiae]MDK8747722.1 hypothetical protein [Streptococcus agalactiae]
MLSVVAFIAGIIAFIFVGKKTITYIFRMSFGLVKIILSILAFFLALSLIIGFVGRL